MQALGNSKTLTISLHCPPRQVYDFVCLPANLPQWATAFCQAVRKAEDEWIVDTPQGPLTIQFVPRNEFGVLDHRVRLPTGEEILNPMRVIPHGSEVLFTLFQRPGSTDEEFAADAAAVSRDLRTLKEVLEARAGCRTPE